jgi:hypothetical protein
LRENSGGRATSAASTKIAWRAQIRSTVHMGVVMLHACERMLLAALPERFESLADHLGMLLGKRSALGGGVGDLGLERDAGGDHC